MVKAGGENTAQRHDRAICANVLRAWPTWQQHWNIGEICQLVDNTTAPQVGQPVVSQPDDRARAAENLIRA
ncbi:hypothetical protein T4B_6934 [Trichinella pseudospiralis]|uniref:Uncharacterized protein n=2 Tax=Trichinella pseudospiralis TaxID=6337 RepID=A0A0V1G2F8_TRIPS|nr:hypothetical protein T4D_9876 [Trichinella pseudospiralis]KRZ34840.1 hypothetical protein T4B_6934 [Trichinella pseudospiralis]KRZ46226.1 hypothetical protein T4C_13195 [Trichinella pseudospiralis]